ncbi:MAG: hypothetical protein ACK4SY_08440 [Pyrobaculum sp.]
MHKLTILIATLAIITYAHQGVATGNWTEGWNCPMGMGHMGMWGPMGSPMGWWNSVSTDLGEETGSWAANWACPMCGWGPMGWWGPMGRWWGWAPWGDGGAGCGWP